MSYTQDELGRLTRVDYRENAQSAPYASRIYHYEARYNAGHPYALTGISVEGVDPATHQRVQQRLSTYAYNAAGQAILSTKGRPLEMTDGKPVPGTGIEQVQVEYIDNPLPLEGRPDKTGEMHPKHLGRAILRNSLGQKTEVTSAVIGGHYRLVEMLGPGCSTCGPSNMRYAYNAAGQLIRATRLDDQEHALQSKITEYDSHGRVARVGRRDEQGRGKAVQWAERREYTDIRYKDGSLALGQQPTLMARPSVIAGKEHTIRIAYDEHGQPLSVTEAGFSPVDERGQPSPLGTRIIRTTTYRYTKVHGRSLLAEIDGPLANGPRAVRRIRMSRASNGAMVKPSRPSSSRWACVPTSTSTRSGEPRA